MVGSAGAAPEQSLVVVQTDAAQHLVTLRWLLLSPSLLRPTPSAAAGSFVWSAGDAQRVTQWLDSLQAQPEALVQWMQARTTKRLGHHAEHLLEFYLTHGPVHQLQAAHVQLRSESGATLGEIDFLVTDDHGQRLHWELAVKFFLCMSTASSVTPHDFLGPNNVETLAHKWNMVFAKQLAHTPPAPWNEHAWQALAFTRGWMFYRWGFTVPTCEALHADHCKGWWIAHADMQLLPAARYVHLPRLQWMAPITSTAMMANGVQLLEREAMAQHLAQYWAANPGRDDAQMIAQLGDGDETTEAQRFFIHYSQ